MNEQPGPAAVGFLERIFEKARAEGSGLRPRLPSLFEPIRYTAGVATEGAEPTEPIDEPLGDIFRRVRDDGGTAARHAAPVLRSHRHDTATARTPPPLEPVQAPGISADTSPAAPAALAPASLAVAHARPSIEPLAARHDRDEPALLRSVGRAATADSTGDSVSTSAGMPAAADAHRESRSTRSISGLPPGRAVRRAVADEEEGEETPAARPPAKNGALLPSPAVAVHRASIAAQATRRRRVPEQGRVETPAADATPVVNVTIGRVEVRAVQTPPQAQRRSEARGARPMSLDEYLKRRGGGR